MSRPTLEACTHTIERPVTWGSMDAFNHVNNTVYFRYFEDVRIAFFEEAGITSFMEEHGIGPILASTQCRFKFPLTYPDTLTIGTYISERSDDRFTMSYVVYSQTHKKIAAVGEGLVVSYDYNQNQKAPLPQEWLPFLQVA
ncbi:MAG: acyl-CoA thioesterase [Deltaproteobacteria bacterium]|nr:MAG: acyl-CoA thioesterase [Deltaproteobacteria bacterium]